MRNKVFNSFDELFEAGIIWGVIPINEWEEIDPQFREFLKRNSKLHHERLFVHYLKQEKLEFNTEDSSYTRLLTKNNLINFFKSKQERETEVIVSVEREKKTWQLQNKYPNHYDFENKIIGFNSKEHKLNFQFGFVPENILEYYKKRNEYIYLGTKTTSSIPILRIINDMRRSSYKGYEWLDDDFNVVFDCYAIGFLKGFESDFSPFISTPENKRELILKAIGCDKGGFPISFKRLSDYEEHKRSAYLDPNSFYEVGLKYGANYKAWMFVLQNPKYYENEFPFVINNQLRNASNVKENKINEENDFLLSTIEDYILIFKDNKSITDSEYEKLKTILKDFFSTGKTTKLSKPIFVKNGNKTRLAYALGELFKSIKNEPLSFEYLELGKNNISLLKAEQIDKSKLNKSNLYKYYTTKP